MLNIWRFLLEQTSLQIPPTYCPQTYANQRGSQSEPLFTDKGGQAASQLLIVVQ
jgi:hypothetical protein